MSPDDLLDRPALELISDETLTAMERDGWTPTQVRALIASYRELACQVETSDVTVTIGDPRLEELVDGVVDTPGAIASALSASEWHELRDELCELRRCAIGAVQRGPSTAAEQTDG